MKFNLHFSKNHSVILETVLQRWLLQSMNVPVTLGCTFLSSYVFWYLCCDDCTQKDTLPSVDLLRWYFSFFSCVFGIELWLTICSLKLSTHSEYTVSSPFQWHHTAFPNQSLGENFDWEVLLAVSQDLSLLTVGCVYIKINNYLQISDM